MNRRRKWGPLSRPRNGWSEAAAEAVDSRHPPPVQAAAASAVVVRSACIRAVRRSWRREPTDRPTDDRGQARARLSERSGRTDGLATVRTELAKQYCRERASEQGSWGGTSKVDIDVVDDDNTYMGRGKEEEATFCAPT